MALKKEALDNEMKYIRMNFSGEGDNSSYLKLDNHYDNVWFTNTNRTDDLKVSKHITAIHLCPWARKSIVWKCNEGQVLFNWSPSNCLPICPSSQIQISLKNISLKPKQVPDHEKGNKQQNLHQEFFISPTNRKKKIKLLFFSSKRTTYPSEQQGKS